MIKSKVDAKSYAPDGMIHYTVADPSDPDEPIGRFDIMTLDWYNYNVRGPSLWSVNVWEEHRGQGHGNMLMQDMLQECENMSFPYISLFVRADNDVATHLYSKYGFEIVLHKLDHVSLWHMSEEGHIILEKHIDEDGHVDHVGCGCGSDDWGCECEDCGGPNSYPNYEVDLCDDALALLKGYLPRPRFTTHQYMMRKELI